MSALVDTAVCEIPQSMLRDIESYFRSMGDRVPRDSAQWAAESVSAVAEAYFSLPISQRENLTAKLLSFSTRETRPYD